MRLSACHRLNKMLVLCRILSLHKRLWGVCKSCRSRGIYRIHNYSLISLIPILHQINHRNRGQKKDHRRCATIPPIESGQVQRPRRQKAPSSPLQWSWNRPGHATAHTLFGSSEDDEREWYYYGSALHLYYDKYDIRHLKEIVYAFNGGYIHYRKQCGLA